MRFPISLGRNLGRLVYTVVENLSILHWYLFFFSAQVQRQPFRFLIAKKSSQELAHRGVNRWHNL